MTEKCRATRHNRNRDIRGYSSAGRAPALQAGGQRFDPAYLHQKEEPRLDIKVKLRIFFKKAEGDKPKAGKYGLIAQPVRAHA